MCDRGPEGMPGRYAYLDKNKKYKIYIPGYEPLEVYDKKNKCYILTEAGKKALNDIFKEDNNGRK